MKELSVGFVGGYVGGVGCMGKCGVLGGYLGGCVVGFVGMEFIGGCGEVHGGGCRCGVYRSVWECMQVCVGPPLHGTQAPVLVAAASSAPLGCSWTAAQRPPAANGSA